MTALCTGAFIAKILLQVIPALSEYKLWIMIGLMLLIWLVLALSWRGNALSMQRLQSCC